MPIVIDDRTLVECAADAVKQQADMMAAGASQNRCSDRCSALVNGAPRLAPFVERLPTYEDEMATA